LDFRRKINTFAAPKKIIILKIDNNGTSLSSNRKEKDDWKQCFPLKETHKT